MFKLFLLFSFLLSNLFSVELTFENIKEYKITTKKVEYILTAKIKKVDFDKLKKFRFFNKKNIISNASYYEKGTLQKNDFVINFKKGYFLEGDFFMEDISAQNGQNKIIGKKAILKKDKLIFDKVYLYQNNRKLRKIKLIYDFK